MHNVCFCGHEEKDPEALGTFITICLLSQGENTGPSIPECPKQLGFWWLRVERDEIFYYSVHNLAVPGIYLAIFLPPLMDHIQATDIL